MRGGWALPLTRETTVMPYAELQWSMAQLDAYTEQGGAFAASVSDQTSRSLTSHLGAELAQRIAPALELQLRAAWAHRLSGSDGRLTATTIGLTQTLGGADGDDNWAEGAVAAIWQVSEATTVSAELGGRSGDSAAPAVDVTLGVAVRF